MMMSSRVTESEEDLTTIFMSRGYTGDQESRDEECSLYKARQVDCRASLTHQNEPVDITSTEHCFIQMSISIDIYISKLNLH